MLDKWISELVDRLLPLRDRLVRSRADRPWLRRLIEGVIAALRWRRAGMTRRSIIVVILSLITLATSALVIVWRLLPKPDPDRPRPVWFYDLSTGQLKEGMSDRVTAMRSGDSIAPVTIAEGAGSDGGDAALSAGHDVSPGARASGAAATTGGAGGAGKAASDTPMVRAYVYSCGSCDNPSERFIGFLETYTPEAHQAIINRPPDRDGVPPVNIDDIVSQGHLVAAPPDQTSDRSSTDARSATQPANVTWHPLHSERGAAIVDVANNGCPGGRMPTQCLP